MKNKDFIVLLSAEDPEAFIYKANNISGMATFSIPKIINRCNTKNNRRVDIIEAINKQEKENYTNIIII